MTVPSPSSSAGALTYIPDGEETMRQVLTESPELQMRSFLALFRQRLHETINLIVREDPKRNPDDAVERFIRGVHLGLSAIIESRQRRGQSGHKGVREYMEGLSIDRIYAAGEKAFAAHVQKPARALLRENRLNERGGQTCILSQAVERCFREEHQQDAVRLVDAHFRRCIDGEIRTMQDVRAFGGDIARLRGILALAPAAEVNAASIRRALQPGIESGLRSLLDLASEHIGPLEVGVFARTYRELRGIRGVTPLTFDVKETDRFFDDFDRTKKSATLRPEARKEYDEACGRAFSGAHAATARQLLRFYLAEVEDRIGNHMFAIGDCPSPEYFFPVHQFSSAVLTGKTARRRRRMS